MLNGRDFAGNWWNTDKCLVMATNATNATNAAVATMATNTSISLTLMVNETVSPVEEFWTYASSKLMS